MRRVLIALLILLSVPTLSFSGKYYNGSSWVSTTRKYYNGSSWVNTTTKRWNGSSWVTLGGGGGETTIATDNFNRADFSTLGDNWTIITNQSNNSVVSNAVSADSTTRRGEYWNANTFAANQCSKITITALSADETAGVGVRVQSAAESGYFGVFDYTAGLMLLRRLDAGTWTVLDSDATTISASDTIKICANGTALTVYKNDSAISSATDATYSTGQPAIFSYATGAWGDDWVGSEL